MKYMKHIIISLVSCLFFSNIHGQIERINYDLTNIKLDSINKNDLVAKLNRIREINDSINIDLNTDSLYFLYSKLSRVTTKDYSSWYFGIGPSYADLSALNDGLRANNLSPLSETAIGVTYLISFAFQRNRFVHDISMGFAFGSKSNSDGISVDYNLIDLLSYKFGYAIINEKRFNMFPYFGLNPQISTLSFANNNHPKLDESTSSYKDLIGFVVNNPGIGEHYFNRFEFTTDIGLQADYHIKYSKRAGGIMLGLRAGKTFPMIDFSWMNDGKKYENLEEINLRDSYLYFIIKFYWRRHDKNKSYPYSVPSNIKI